ncbi:hypothetical protein PF003_g1099 [Phytophthora fragariae]|nr:hypothetical protein PF003_g1099 [Phytophthora fragariae]
MSSVPPRDDKCGVPWHGMARLGAALKVSSMNGLGGLF